MLSVDLAVHFPDQGASPVYHVPQVYHAWVRLRLSAGGLARLRQENWEPLNRPRTFWSSLSASLALIDDDV
jgi:hypothetical protein